MTAEMVTVVHVEEEEKEVTLSSPSKVNVLEKDKEEVEEVREEISNGANGGTVTVADGDGDGDGDGSYVFINGNDALNGDPVELDLVQNGNGIEGEDRSDENLEIKGELKSESDSVKDLEGENGSSIGITDQDKEPVELCHVEDPVVAVVEEKPREDLVDSGPVSTINAEEDGVLKTAATDEYGVSETSCAEEIGVSEASGDNQNGVTVSETPGDNQNGVIPDEVGDSESSGANQKGEFGVLETSVVNQNGVTLEEDTLSETAADNLNGATPEDFVSETLGAIKPKDGISETTADNLNGVSPEEESVLESSGANQNSVTADAKQNSVTSDANKNGVVQKEDAVSKTSSSNQNGAIPRDDVSEIACANLTSGANQGDGDSETNQNGVPSEEDDVTETSFPNQNEVTLEADGVSKTSCANQNAVTPEGIVSETFSASQNGNRVIPEDGVLENNIRIDSNGKISSVPVSNGFNHFTEESGIVVVDGYRNSEVYNHISTGTKKEYDFSNENGTTREEVTEIEITAVVENEEGEQIIVVEKEETIVEKEIEGNAEAVAVVEKEEIVDEKEVEGIAEAVAVVEKEEIVDKKEVEGISEAVAVVGKEETVDEKEVEGIAESVAVVEKEETVVEKEVEGNAETVAVVEKEETVVEEEVEGNVDAVAIVEKEIEGNVDAVVVVEKEVEGNAEAVAFVEKEETVVEKEVEGNAEAVAVVEKEETVVEKEVEGIAESVADIEGIAEAVADTGDLNPEAAVENPEVSASEPPVENTDTSKEVSADSLNPEDACNIQFGSFSKELEAVDEVVLKRPFYWLIRVPRYDDESLKEKIRLAQMTVDEKTKCRDAIRDEMQAKKAMCKEYSDNFDAAKSQERAARDLLKSKRQGIDSIQSEINIDDIDGRIRNMEHMIQHETLPLKEEKQLIRDIKQLKQVREQLLSSKGRNDEVQQGSDQKEQIEKRMKSLKKEADQLRDELQKAEAVTRAAKKTYFDETEKFNKLLSQFKAADDIRQEAYAELQSLKKQSYEKNKCYWQYRDDAKKANDLSLKSDKEALQNLCVNQVERFMELWNSDDEFRKEYLKRNLRSTLRRFRTLDGRALGPDEQPLVIPQVAPPQAAENERGAKNHVSNEQTQEKVNHIVSDEQMPQKVVPTKVVKEHTQDKVVLAKAVKSVPVSATTISIATAPSSYENEEEKSKKSEEEELARKAEKLRKEEEEVKLREQRRLDEIAKAKEAQERKKRIAEKAQARAAQRAQKEAEQKEKEREKKARKKERRKLAAVSVESETNVSDEVEPAQTSETPALEISKEPEMKERTITVSKRSQKPSQFTKTKSIPPPLRKGKRRMQPWMWVLLTVVVIFSLFLVGNSNFLKVSMQRFNF